MMLVFVAVYTLFTALYVLFIVNTYFDLQSKKQEEKFKEDFVDLVVNLSYEILKDYGVSRLRVLTANQHYYLVGSFDDGVSLQLLQTFEKGKELETLAHWYSIEIDIMKKGKHYA